MKYQNIRSASLPFHDHLPITLSTGIGIIAITNPTKYLDHNPPHSLDDDVRALQAICLSTCREVILANFWIYVNESNTVGGIDPVRDSGDYGQVGRGACRW